MLENIFTQMVYTVTGNPDTKVYTREDIIVMTRRRVRDSFKKTWWLVLRETTFKQKEIPKKGLLGIIISKIMNRMTSRTYRDIKGPFDSKIDATLWYGSYEIMKYIMQS